MADNLKRQWQSAMFQMLLDENKCRIKYEFKYNSNIFPEIITHQIPKINQSIFVQLIL